MAMPRAVATGVLACTTCEMMDVDVELAYLEGEIPGVRLRSDQEILHQPQQAFRVAIDHFEPAQLFAGRSASTPSSSSSSR